MNDEEAPSSTGLAAAARGLPVEHLRGGGVVVTLPDGGTLIVRDPRAPVDPRIEACPRLDGASVRVRLQEPTAREVRAYAASHPGATVPVIAEALRASPARVHRFLKRKPV